jgi:putative hydroxymethylpyrimidine transporter CytX
MNNAAMSQGEAPITLDLHEQVSRSLDVRDQLTLWSSLGVSLLIPATAVFVVKPVAELPRLSMTAVTTAIILGTALGSFLLALTASISTTLGTPSMVTMRGLLGQRGSLVPTVLNLIQCCGWAALEVYVIAQVATAITHGQGRTWWTLLAGAGATVLAIRPIRSVRVIRRYLMWLVVLATAYLLWNVITHQSGTGVHESGTWQAFWPAFDIVVTMPISWAVLAGDWSRQSRSRRATVIGVGGGYALMCAVFFLVGALAVTNSNLADVMSPSAFVNGLLAVPVGALALAILAVDEVDEAFANIYSTAVSAQNVFTRIDRRVAAALVGILATVLALTVNLESYEAFLLLIGAIFLPLVAVMLSDWFIVRRVKAGCAGGGFSVTEPTAPKSAHFGVWLLGVAVYSVLNPAPVPGWVTFWNGIADHLPQVTHGHGSATVITLAVTSIATVTVGLLRRR